MLRTRFPAGRGGRYALAAASLAVMVVFLVRGVVPIWFVLLLVSRDAVLSVQMARLKRKGVTGLPVNFVGKAATFNLMISFPLLLWGVSAVAGPAMAARVLGWSLAIWGAGLYLYSGGLYVRQSREILTTRSVAGG